MPILGQAHKEGGGNRLRWFWVYATSERSKIKKGLNLNYETAPFLFLY